MKDSIVDSNEQVFQNVYIPRTLDEIDDHEADVAKILKGETPDLVYQSVTGLNVAKVVQDRSSKKEEELSITVARQEAFTSKAKGIIGESDGGSSDSEKENENEEPSDADDEDAESEEGEDDQPFKKNCSNLKKNEDKAAKKARKAAVKDEKREARKTKMPKAMKKQKTKSSKK